MPDDLPARIAVAIRASADPDVAGVTVADSGTVVVTGADGAAFFISEAPAR